MDDRKAMTAIFYIDMYWVSVESATTKKSWCIQYVYMIDFRNEERWCIQTNVD